MVTQMRRRTMLLHPLHQRLKLPTPMMRAEISTSSHRRLGINFNQIRRRVTVAHERQTQRFDTMIHVHAGADFRILEIAGKVRRGVGVVAAPGVLSYEVLMMKTVKKNDGGETLADGGERTKQWS